MCVGIFRALQLCSNVLVISFEDHCVKWKRLVRDRLPRLIDRMLGSILWENACWWAPIRGRKSGGRVDGSRIAENRRERWTSGTVGCIFEALMLGV